ETACPSGVRYAPLIEETRAAIEHHHTRSLGDRLFRRLLFSLLPYPARLRLFALPLALVNSLRGRPGLLSLLPRRLRNLVELAPDARHARRGHDASHGRPPHRLRPAGVLRPRERRDGPGTRRRGLRRPGPALARLLRRARAAFGPR